MKSWSSIYLVGIILFERFQKESPCRKKSATHPVQEALQEPFDGVEAGINFMFFLKQTETHLFGLILKLEHTRHICAMSWTQTITHRPTFLLAR